MIQDREIERRYLALAWGEPRFEKALVDAPIGRDPSDRKRMAVLPLAGPGDFGPRSRVAKTELGVTERFGFCSALECKLLTGRTHQIRVHLAYAGHPILNDATYGGGRRPPIEAFATSAPRVEFERLYGGLRGQALHAGFLAFLHPITAERLEFAADPPENFSALLQFLRETRISKIS
jgi:23S rRNA pseudouridine1911/1915/1917 synthase